MKSLLGKRIREDSTLYVIVKKIPGPVKFTRRFDQRQSHRESWALLDVVDLPRISDVQLPR